MSISEIENTRLVDGELLVVFCVSASILFARCFDTFAHMRSSLVERTIMQYQLDVGVLRAASIISMHPSRSDHLFLKWLLTVLSMKPAVSEAPDTRITAARMRHLADRYRTNQITSRAGSSLEHQMQRRTFDVEFACFAHGTSRFLYTRTLKGDTKYGFFTQTALV